jgi:hypothetical protein
MAKSATRAKTRWNAKNYTQVKVSIDPGVAASFKVACAKAGLSMAGVLSQFMAQYGGAAKEGWRTPAEDPDVSTRGKRRRLVVSLTRRMEKIRDAEDGYLSRIPENLQLSTRYDAAEHSVSVMDEVIGLLEDIY